MPELDSPSITFALKQAHAALQLGEKSVARFWAQDVVRHNPKEIKALLILAYVSSPQEGIGYLNQVLEIDPHNENAIKGIRWLTEKIPQQKLPDTESPLISDEVEPAVKVEEAEEITQPIPVHEEKVGIKGKKPSDASSVKIRQFRERFSTAFRIFRYLGKKALLIFATIFVGIFITIIIIDRPVTLGFSVKPPQLETNLQKQIEQTILVYKYEHPSYYYLTEEEQQKIDDDLRTQLIKDTGLDLPYLPKHLLWTLNALKFDWGKLRSVNVGLLPMLGYGRVTINLNDVVLKHLPNTMLLAVFSNLLVFLLGLPLALMLSRNYGKWFDKFFVMISPLFSIPSWVIGIILVAIFAVWLRILPVGGMLDTLPPETPIGYIPIILKHMALPVLAIFLSLFFQLVYSWRTYFLIYSEEDYVVLGKSIGLSQRRLQQKYILRPSIAYMLTSFSLLLVSFWQMTMALEVIFDWPGLGWLFIKVGLPNFWGESMYPGEMVIALTIIVAFAYLLGMIVFVLDIIYVLVDPRIRVDKGEPVLHEKVFHSKMPTHFPKKVPAPSNLNLPKVAPVVHKKRTYHTVSLKEHLLSISAKFKISSKIAFRQLRKYPFALIGLFIIIFLVIGSLVAVFGLPYEKVGAQWSGSQIKGQALVPRLAQPSWVNFFRKENSLSTLIIDNASDAENYTRTESEFSNGQRQISLTYTFDYKNADFPSEIYLYFDSEFEIKRPFASITWITPDGREFNLNGVSAISGTNYDFEANIPVRRLVNKNEHLKNWFVFGQIDPTPSHYVLFADLNADEEKLVKGQYTLRVNGITFEENSTLDAKLVLLGHVYGLAGTDTLRRDLLTPILWGMPIALGFGLMGALATTLLSMIISAAGVWFGSWVDNLIQRMTEINLVLPTLAICVLAYAYLGVNLWVILVVIIVLNVFGSPTKNFRSAFLNIKEAPYIEAAQSYGASSFRIIMKYMVPRIIPVMVPQLLILIPSFVFLEATLGLFNISTGYPTWGTIIYQALTQGGLYYAQYRLLEPLALVIITGLAFSLFGFTLEQILNPRLQNE
jgi:peptide/nickel transport system permease protein